MTGRPWRRLLLLASLPLLASGCYGYTSSGTEQLTPGTAVRARVSDSEADRIARVLPGAGSTLTGRFVSENPSGVLLEVPSAERPVGGAAGPRTLYQRIRVPRTGLLEVETRRLDKPRTFALVGGGVVLGAIVAAQMLQGGDPGTVTQQPGGPDELVVPIRAGLRLLSLLRR